MSISVGGLVSGLDTNGMIEQMLELQQKPIENLKQQEADYGVELSSYGKLQSVLEKLQTAMDDINSEKDLTSYSATSGDEDLFTVSADDDATVGVYNITVTTMAEAHKLTSDPFGVDDPVGEGTIQLNVGSITSDIAVSDTDSLEDVARAINDADVRVKAAVIFDGTNNFLTLASEDTGVENVITLTVDDTGDGSDLDKNGISRLAYVNMTDTQTAADAIITVDGVTDIHRPTNEINDVLQGVTITLKTTSTTESGNASSLTVKQDRLNIISGINAFVKAYNDAMTLIDTEQAYDDSTDTAGILMGDRTTNSIRTRLEKMIASTVSGAGVYEKLDEMGIELNGEGKLEVDSSTINGALDDNFDDVIRFFSQSTTGADGFAVGMTNILDAMLDTKDGSLTTRTEGIQKSIDSIEDKVETMDRRNEIWETRIRDQFNSMELLLSKYQNTGEYLTQQITGMQNLNSYISNR